MLAAERLSCPTPNPGGFPCIPLSSKGQRVPALLPVVPMGWHLPAAGQQHACYVLLAPWSRDNTCSSWTWTLTHTNTLLCSFFACGLIKDRCKGRFARTFILRCFPPCSQGVRSGGWIPLPNTPRDCPWCHATCGAVSSLLRHS